MTSGNIASADYSVAFSLTIHHTQLLYSWLMHILMAEVIWCPNFFLRPNVRAYPIKVLFPDCSRSWLCCFQSLNPHWPNSEFSVDVIKVKSILQLSTAIKDRKAKNFFLRVMYQMLLSCITSAHQLSNLLNLSYVTVWTEHGLKWHCFPLLCGQCQRLYIHVNST